MRPVTTLLTIDAGASTPLHHKRSLADSYLPQFDVSDTVACAVAADADASWAALMETDLWEVLRRRKLAATLAALRTLPDVVARLVHGEGRPPVPERMRLRDTVGTPGEDGGWVLLADRPRELALGLVGKFWRPVIEYADVPAGRFRGFAEPGWAKTVYYLCAEPIDANHTLLKATMQTATTDEASRRRFRRYWTFGVGSGAHVLVGALLDLARERAENGRPAPERGR
jgi:hypothetical protein